ncbi:MAG TPA: hypothetical protein VLI72_14120, partial [Methylibium sp.]|nr:hypothetical protein [Methylibium sp.]
GSHLNLIRVHGGRPDRESPPPRGKPLRASPYAPCRDKRLTPLLGTSTSALGQAERLSLGYSSEVATVLSRDGQVLARQILSESGGSLSAEVLGAMRGNTFTHNHPRGGSFSPDDVMTALAYQPSEFRAVTSTRSLSLSFDKPPADLLGIENAANIELFMASEQKAIGASFRQAVANGRLLPPTEQAMRDVFKSNYFMQQLSSRNSWIRYEVAPR